MALFQLPGDVLHGNAHLDHQHHDVVGQIRDLVDGLLLVLLATADDDLGALLAHLLEDLVQALVEEVGGVAALLGVGLAALDQVVETLIAELLEFLGQIHRLEKAALRAGVAGLSLIHI